jgi:ABC-type polysaccharide/polyol phosphate export permease
LENSQLRDLSIADLQGGLARYRAWITLALDDLNGRYSRTILGPFWSAISMGLLVVAFGFWSSAVFKKDISEQMIYLAAGLPVWTLISNTIVDAPSIFPRAQAFLLGYSLPASIHVHRAVVGQFIAFAHNLIIYVVAFAIFRPTFGWEFIYIIPGLLIVYVALTGLALGLSCLGARYRDLAPLLTAIVGALFVLTPIFWRVDTVIDAQWIANYNPLYHLMEVIRAPLMGAAPSMLNWIAATSIAIVSLVAGGAIFVSFRAKLSYWI